MVCDWLRYFITFYSLCQVCQYSTIIFCLYILDLYKLGHRLKVVDNKLNELEEDDEVKDSVRLLQYWECSM